MSKISYISTSTTPYTYCECTDDSEGYTILTSINLTKDQESDINTILKNKTLLTDQASFIPCWNPKCNNLLIISKDEKHDFLIRFYKNYGKTVLPFCCKACRDEFYALMTNEEQKDDHCY